MPVWQRPSCRLFHPGGVVSDLVLVSWIARNNDPFERDQPRGHKADRDQPPPIATTKPVDGPTLMLLTDPESPYAGRVSDVVLFQQGGAEAEVDRKIYERLRAVLHERCPSLRVQSEVWENCNDPTDHQAIFAFLRERLPNVRRQFSGRELVIHISPGTPSMQTVWVLMAETGFIEQPFSIVKSYRKGERRGRGAVVPVNLGIDTFYKRYIVTRPKIAPAEPFVQWDPARFQSPKLRALYRDARRIAALKIPVLILGERGTGKTTLASWIRFSSPYRKESLDQGWPAVACGQYNAETMRSELFGYKKGSHSRAASDHLGLLHLAHQDTLFLDEVGDVSRELQRLLIKALEEGKYQPLGATKFEKSDFRLITATNMPLHTLVERLDPDFFDRISVFQLRVPALREIPDDIPWLWDNVFEQAARRTGVDLSAVHLDEASRDHLVNMLRKHPLPGNIRDLFRVAYRLLAIRTDDLEPVPISEAVEYALGALDAVEGSAESPSHQLARAFADRRPLDPGLVNDGPVQTVQLFTDLQAYLASEIRRLAKERGVKVENIADVAERTLRNWARKNVAGGSED